MVSRNLTHGVFFLAFLVVGLSAVGQAQDLPSGDIFSDSGPERDIFAAPAHTSETEVSDDEGDVDEPPSASVAADMLKPTRSDTPSEEEIQLATSQLKEELQRYMCQDKGKWLECFALQAKDCERIVSQFVNPCVEEAIPDIRKAASEEKMTESTMKLAQCFNKIFLHRYGLGRVYTPECAEPPEHLR